MKIAVIAPTEIPAQRANTMQVMKMAQALTHQGHQIRLMAPRSGSRRRLLQHLEQDPKDELVASTWERIAHHYGLAQPFDISWLFSHPKLRRYDYSWRAVQKARRWPADLIYTRLPQAAALASWLGAPTILEVHDLPQGRFGPFFLRQFLHGRGARRLVVITQALAKDLTHEFGALLHPPLLVIAPDGVDLERFEGLPTPEEARRQLSQAEPSSAQTALLPPRFTVGYTGHLYPGRGSQLLLELARRLPEVNFLIVGGEPEHVHFLQAQVDTHALENVWITGFVPNAELPRYQAACEALLMPYQYKVEASSGGDIARYLSPMKLFEYLACGRAIISSALPVLQEVLNPENSLLVPADQPQAWEEALRRLITDADLRSRLGSQARKDAHFYTWEARAQKILAG